jgi:protein-tyrosine kinase
MSDGKPSLAERAAEKLRQAGLATSSLTNPSVQLPNDGQSTSLLTPGVELATAQFDGPAPAIQHEPVDTACLARAGLIEGTGAQRRISEEFRLVESQVVRTAFGQLGNEPGFSNLLMVTSARPNEGKTFTAINLAASIASCGGRRVLLIDLDHKRNSLTEYLGLSDELGVLDLADIANPSAAGAVHPTAVEGLQVLPSGRTHERADQYTREQIIRVVQRLGRHYADHLLVLDAPPCLSTSDPAALAHAVGQILLVVEAERTQREEVEASLDLIQTCPTITLLLNKVQMSTPRSFGAYSYSYAS